MRSVEVVQQMIDWMEENMEELPTLQMVSNAVGYSPWYCSCMFHDITGMTMKSYIAGRRLARIMEDIRDTQERILDIAVKSEEFPMFLAIIALMMAFSIPVQTRFGANGSRMFMLIAVGIALLLGFIVNKVVDAETWTAIQRAFEQISGAGRCLLVIGTVCLSLIISYLCSLRAMKKIEF